MANLIVDIGNTALKASWCDGITLGKTYRYQGERMLEYILSMTEKERPEILVLSSVRHFSPQNIHRLEEVCDRLLVVDESVLESYGLPLWMTPDRAASIVASRYLFKGKSCTVFDFGTTLKIDFLSSDGRYMGGNISPGCTTRFKSLNRYAKNIPLVDIPADAAQEGTSLVSSLEAGVISGIKFEIEGYINSKKENVVIFTGGDAIYFAKKMKNSIFVVCNLELMGLALITEDYVKKNNI